MLPNIVLDGELHGGRGNFSKACGIARRLDADEEWKELKFTIFDVPTAAGVSSLSYAARLSYARNVAEACPRWVQVVTYERVESPSHVNHALAAVEEGGGEGLVLRHPTAPYEWKRTANALKVKSEQDAEATVIGMTEGVGKHAGRMGALVCQLPNGVQFKVGTGFSDEEREQKQWIGLVITFSYFEIFEKTGKPRHPSFVRVRTD